MAEVWKLNYLIYSAKNIKLDEKEQTNCLLPLFSAAVVFVSKINVSKILTMTELYTGSVLFQRELEVEEAAPRDERTK